MTSKTNVKPVQWANTVTMGVTASRVVREPSRTAIRVPVKAVQPGPSQMELGCANRVVWARHQTRTSNTVSAVPPIRPGLVGSARNVVLENSQMQNRVRALHALLAKLELEVAARRVHLASSQTVC